MSRRGLQSNNRSQSVKREKDPIPWRYCFLTLVCGLILVVGFFWAARQHFSAMDYGIKNAKLRQQKEGLEAEQRRLFLSKEIALSPAELQKAAQKIGLQELSSQNIEVIEAAEGPVKKDEAIAPDTAVKPEVKPQIASISKPQPVNSQVTKTVSSEPVKEIKEVKKEETPKPESKKEPEKPKAEVKFSKDGKAQPIAKTTTKEVKKSL